MFTIDILKGENISSKTLAMNDDEDSFVGKTEVLEYSIDNGKTWKAFDRDTRITGNQTVLARYRAHGVYLSGDSTEYNFTENNDKEKNMFTLKIFLTYLLEVLKVDMLQKYDRCQSIYNMAYNVGTSC